MQEEEQNRRRFATPLSADVRLPGIGGKSSARRRGGFNRARRTPAASERSSRSDAVTGVPGLTSPRQVPESKHLKWPSRRSSGNDVGSCTARLSTTKCQPERRASFAAPERRSCRGEAQAEVLAEVTTRMRRHCIGRSSAARRRRPGERQAIEAMQLRRAGHPPFERGFSGGAKRRCRRPGSVGTGVARRLTRALQTDATNRQRFCKRKSKIAAGLPRR